MRWRGRCCCILLRPEWRRRWAEERADPLPDLLALPRAQLLTMDEDGRLDDDELRLHSSEVDDQRGPDEVARAVHATLAPALVSIQTRPSHAGSPPHAQAPRSQSRNR